MITVKTDYPLALDSPDYLHPWGTKRDNMKSFQNNFQKEAIELFGKDMAFMDLGCAGGGLPVQFHKMGITAVGLEGSDYNLNHESSTQTVYHLDKRQWGSILDSWIDPKTITGALTEDTIFLSEPEITNLTQQWKTYHNKVLFTCDISRPFQVLQDGNPMQFDLITCWEVMEHLPKDRIPTFLENVKNHLKPEGIFTGTITLNDDFVGDVNLHQSNLKLEEWDAFLMKDFEHREGRILDRLRYDFYSIYFHLSKRKNK